MVKAPLTEQQRDQLADQLRALFTPKDSSSSPEASAKTEDAAKEDK